MGKFKSNKAYLIKVGETPIEVEPKNGTDFGLEELQGYVDGYIEIVRVSRTHIAVVDEEGILKQKEYNVGASFIAEIQLFGDVVICPSNMVR